MTLLRAAIAGMFALVSIAFAQQEEPRDYPLGPIGGSFRIAAGSNFARVTALTAGAPGDLAGLKLSDSIYGAFGKKFSPVGDYHFGLTQELGFAVDRAEGGNGALPLMVLRPGVGPLTITVNLPAVGAFGPAYPRGSAKHQAMFEEACAYLHQRVMATGNGEFGYFTGWTGLVLLGHPNWNDTTGAKPYRLSINKIRDLCVTKINAALYAPVEDKLFDGSPNPNFSEGAASNWTLGQWVFFLSEYKAKTGDTSVQPAIQRGAEICANVVQWWKQPALNSNGYSPTLPGIISHGGVGGDYIHLGWGGGINMTGCYPFNGMAFAKRAGANMTVQPRDGHYFGYPTAPIGAVPAGLENKDYSINEKFQMVWTWMTQHTGYFSAGNIDDGHVCYTLQGASAWDAAGRTPGAALAMSVFSMGETLSAGDADKLERLKAYCSRHYIRQQEAHAYNIGAQSYQALLSSFWSDRQQRFAMDNWRFYYALSRTPTGGFQYFRARIVNDNYLDETICAAINAGLPYVVANGGLAIVPGYKTNRILAHFQSPDVTWPTIETRVMTTTSSSVSMPVSIVNGSGQTQATNTYTAQWTKLAGPGNVTFSAPTAATTNITFSAPGSYRVQLAVTQGAQTLIEPLAITVMTATPPAGHTLGLANYQVYTDIAGITLANLTSAAKYPNSPDITRMITSLSGNHSGDNFGARLSGAIIPPLTGSYRFYIASDDASQLKLNPSGMTPSGATVVASVNGSTSPQEWTKNASQQSEVFNLTAGSAIYFEALHKEGGGAEHVTVGWSINGGPIELISAANIAGVVPAMPNTMSIVQQPQPASTTLGGTVTLAFQTNGPTPANYQWRRNGVPFGAPRSTPTLELVNVSGAMDADFDCLYTTELGSLTTNSVRVSITNGGAFMAGGLWRELYSDVSGGTVASLTAHPKYPYLADIAGVIPTAATGDQGESYGQRWTGWLKPTITGNYRFFLAADDAAEIWLSTNELDSGKVKIKEITSYTGVKRWSASAPSAYIPLIAGRRYFIEVIHKEGGGGDHCAVAWQREGTPAPVNDSGEIPSANLEYRVGGVFGNTPRENLPPVFDIDPIALSNAVEGVAYSDTSIAPHVSDSNTGDTWTFSKVSGPAWLNVAANGTISGTPPTRGPVSAVVRATDQGGLFAQATVNLEVEWNNLPPQFPNSNLVFASAPAKAPYLGDLTGSATDPNLGQGDSLTFSKTSGPAWLTVAANGTLGGTPDLTNIGNNTFGVKVTDAKGLFATATLSITVAQPDFYYDVNGAVAGSGAGSGGPWGAELTWSGSVNGTNSHLFGWADGANAHFAAGTDASSNYTVTVSGTRVFGALNFRNGKPLITGGTLQPANATTSVQVATAGADARIDSPMTGTDRGIVKTGAGKLILGGNNTFTGNLTIQQGELELTAAGKLYNGGHTNTPVITVEAGATWRVPDFSYAGVGKLSDYAERRVLNGGTLEITGATHSSGQNFTVTPAGATLRYTPAGQTLTLAGNGLTDLVLNGTLTAQAIGDITVNEILQGTGGLVKTGAGTLTLGSNGNSFTGNIDINDGTVLASRGGSLINGTLGAVNGSRTIRVKPNATLRLTSNDVFSGSSLAQAANLPLIDVDRGTLDSTRFNLIGNVTLRGATMSQSSSDGGGYQGFHLLGTIAVRGTDASTMSTGNAKVNHLANAGTTFDVDDVTGNATTDLLVSLPLANASGVTGGTGALIKSGTGTMTLSGVSTYTGATTINAGTLEVTGALSNNSAITVGANGILAGTGTAKGAASVAGALAPGVNGAGTLAAGAITMSTGSRLRWDIGAANDLINATSLNLSGSPAIQVTLAGSSLVTPGGSPVTIPLITTTNGITGFSGATFTVNASAVTGTPAIYQVLQQGNNLVLTAAPSASTYASWRQQAFGSESGNPAIAGADADPDRDGIKNLLEYALGTDPNIASGAIAVIPDIAQVSGGSYLRLTVTKNPNATDLVYRVVAGTDLLGWSDAGLVIESNTPTILRVRDSQPFAGQPKRFLRLEVTLQP